ncbi:AIDA repeat-containing protein, partial [Roseiarcus fermentans]|uniref:AIDA repeat-containing protein n=1 Tax=Roseiarcus fermentans TaxID=1473586 RepID=UPI00147340AB
MSSGGQVGVDVGGSLSSTTISDSGNVWDHGSATSTTILSGGFLFIDSAATANSVTVSSGGGLDISSGATTSAITLENGGTIWLDGGASNSITYVAASNGVGIDVVERNWTLSNTSTVISASGYSGFALGVAKGGVLFVEGQGQTVFTSVYAGGEEDVFSGGSSYNGFVSSGGGQTVSSGGNTSNTNILDGGQQLVWGGTAKEDYVYGTGDDEVIDGGLTSWTHLGSGAQAGGTEYVSLGGKTINTWVNSGGQQSVGVSGTATSTNVLGGGVQWVENEGVANATSVSGNSASGAGQVNVLSGGSATALVVEARGVATVQSGGSVTDVTVSSGGTLIIDSGARVTDATVETGATEEFVNYALGVSGGNGQTLDLSANVSALSAQIGFGGQLFADVQGAAAIDAMVSSGGRLLIASGASALDTEILSSGSAVLLLGAVASGTRIDSGGVLLVSSGASADVTLPYAHGSASLNAGGLLDYGSVRLDISGTTTLSAGAIVGQGVLELDGSGAVVTDGLVTSTQLGSQTGFHGSIYVDPSVTVSVTSGSPVSNLSDSGAVDVDGGATFNTSVFSGAHEWIGPGGVASATVVGFGAVETIASGGLARGTILSSGGVQSVMAGGVAVSAIVSSGGSALALSGATFSGGVVLSHGVVSVQAGGSGVSVTVSSGGDLVYDASGVDPSVIVAELSGDTLISGGEIDISGLVITSGETFSALAGYRMYDTVVEAGGALDEATSAATWSTTIQSGGYVSAAPGGFNFLPTLDSGGTIEAAGLNVSFGGDMAALGTSLIDNSLEVGPGRRVDASFVGDGGLIVFESGGRGRGNAIAAGGAQSVLQGGVAINTQVSSGGVDDVFSSSSAGDSGYAQGGADSGAQIYNGGVESVYQLGSANGTVIYDGGQAIIGSGGTAYNVSVGSGGSETILAGGVDSDAIVLGAQVISSGGVATSAYVSGGVDPNTHVGYGGLQAIASGGRAADTIVADSGAVVVGSGGGLGGATVESGGVEAVKAGGSAFADTIASGGVAIVSAGGVDSGATVEFGGALTVAGVAATATVGGQETILGGGVANQTIVQQSGVQHVSSGATASGTVIERGGALIEDPGANVVNAVLQSGGHIIYADVLVSGSTLVVSAGYGVLNATVEAGGEIVVLSGGVAIDTVVKSNGVQADEGGYVTGTTVLLGGVESVFAGASAAGTVVSSGGDLSVALNGEAASTMVSSGGSLVDAGLVVGTDILSGGSALIQSGGLASATSVTTSGTEIVGTSGVAVGDVIAPGGVEVISGGQTSNAVVSYAGSQVVSAGTATGTVVNSGGIQLVIGGAASNTVVSSGAGLLMSGGVVEAASVLSSGTIVGSGGALNDSIVFAGGIVSLGGSASGNDDTLSGGALGVSGSASVTDATVDSGGFLFVQSGGVASGTTVNRGGIEDVSGGVAVSTVVGVLGQEVTTAGGLSLDDLINAGGYEFVSSGGVADFTSVSGFETSSGTLHGTIEVYNGGYAFGAQADADGIVFIQSSGSAVYTNISSGGGIQIASGGYANSTYISSGGLFGEMSGGTDINTTYETPTAGEIAKEVVSGVLFALNVAIVVGTAGADVLGDGKLVGSVAKDATTALEDEGATTTEKSVSTLEQDLAKGANSTEQSNLVNAATNNLDNVSNDAAAEKQLGDFSEQSDISNDTQVVNQDVNLKQNEEFLGIEIVDSNLEASNDNIENFSLEQNSELVQKGGEQENISIASFSKDEEQDCTDVESIAVENDGDFEAEYTDADIQATLKDINVESGGKAGITNLTSANIKVALGLAKTATTVVKGAMQIANADGSPTDIVGGVLTLLGAGYAVASMPMNFTGTSMGVPILWNALVSAGGLVQAYGATISKFEAANSGWITAEGGTATDVYVHDMGEIDVLADETAFATTATFGGVVEVADGGITSNTVVSGGSNVVSSGGVDIAGSVYDGGAEVVHSGGFASALVVGVGGSETISGGSALGALVSGWSGVETVLNGGVATDTTLSAGGAQVISSGGLAIGTIVAGGGTETILNGGVATSATLSAGGSQVINAGGLANATTVASGGEMIVSVGGMASGLTIQSGGVVVDSGGQIEGAIELDAGGELILDNPLGGALTGTIAGGGEVVVEGGGTYLVGSGDASQFSGTVKIVSGAVEMTSGGALGSATIAFPVGADPTLKVDGPSALRNLIENFTSLDTIDLAGIAYDSLGSIVANGDGTVTIALHGSSYTLNLSALGLRLSDDGAGGTDITVAPAIGGIAASQSVSDTGTFALFQSASVREAAAAMTLTVQMSSPNDGAFSDSAGGDINATTGVYTVTGSPDQVTSALDDLAFTPTAGQTAFGDFVRTQFQIVVTDDAGHSTSAAASVDAYDETLNVGAGQTASNTLVGSGFSAFVHSGGVISATTVVSGGALVVSSGGVVTGGLTLAGGTATVSGAVGSGQDVVFAGSGGYLRLDDLSDFQATISGFGAGDAIDLGDFSYSSAVGVLFGPLADGLGGTLLVANGGGAVALVLSGSYATSNFALSADGAHGTLISFATPAAVTSVGAPAAGDYGVGSVLTFTVGFDQPVDVTGTPRIAIDLATGGVAYANYVSGGGTSALTFQYTVAAGQQALAGITTGSTIDLNGGAITDAAGDPANLDLSAVEPSTSGVVINTFAPTESVAQVLATMSTLNALPTGFAVADTAAAIGAYLTASVATGPSALALDASHITAITASGGTVTVGNGVFAADQPALDKIVGGFAISGRASVLNGNLDGLEADQARIDSVTAKGGAITATIAQFTADQPLLDKVVGGFVVSDTAAAIGAYLTASVATGPSALALDASHITAITASGGTVTVGNGVFAAD